MLTEADLNRSRWRAVSIAMPGESERTLPAGIEAGVDFESAAEARARQPFREPPPGVDREAAERAWYSMPDSMSYWTENGSTSYAYELRGETLFLRSGATASAPVVDPDEMLRAVEAAFDGVFDLGCAALETGIHATVRNDELIVSRAGYRIRFRRDAEDPDDGGPDRSLG